MSELMENIERIGSDPNVMRWSGAIVLSLLGYGFMRVRKHSVASSFAFAGGIFGGIVLLSVVKYFLF